MMITNVKTFYLSEIDGRTPIKSKPDFKLKIREVSLILYGVIFFLAVFSIELYPVFGMILVGLFTLDFILIGFFSTGIFRMLYSELQRYEFQLWKEVIKNDKMKFKNRFKYIRKYKKKKMWKFLKKNKIQLDIDFVISRLTQRKDIRLTISTVCVSAIFLAISALLLNLMNAILTIDQTILYWGQIEASELNLWQQLICKAVFILLHLLKLAVIVSPFFFALLYFRVFQLKSDTLIELLEEIRLGKK